MRVYRVTAVRAFVAGAACLVMTAAVQAQPVTLLAQQDQSQVSSFTFDFGEFGGVASARITDTDLAIDVDTGIGSAEFVEYSQQVDPITLPGGISTGNLQIEIVPGTSSGTFDALTGEFATTELYAIHFDGDLSAYQLESPVYLEGNSMGSVALTTDLGGSVALEWSGSGELVNPYDPNSSISFSYTCSLAAGFPAEPVAMVGLGLIPEVTRLELSTALENSLISRLDAALYYSMGNNNKSAVNALGAFINKVDAQSGKRISEAEADFLIHEAYGTMQMLGTTKHSYPKAKDGRPTSDR